MQYNASLNGTTATIAVKHMNPNTSLTITDASNLAADLAAFTSSDATAVDASSFTTSGTIPPAEGITMPNDPSFAQGGMPLDAPNRQSWDRPSSGLANYSPGFASGGQRNRDFQVHSRGYLLTAKEDGVEIMTPGTTSAVHGTMTIPRNQIASIIAQLNA
ncbi:MAG: hypothetical protein ABJQ23_14870 [Shimia thalassica]